MNTVQNGKGDRPRNNWGQSWYDGYANINWRGAGQRIKQAGARSASPEMCNPQDTASPSGLGAITSTPEAGCGKG